VADTQYVISYDRALFSGKSKVSGRWFYDNGNTNAPFGTASTLAFPQSVVQNNRFLTLSHTQEISNRQLNVFRFGFSRFLSTFAPNDIAGLSDIGATRPNSGTVPGIYQVAVTGAFSLGTGVNDERGTVSNSFDYNDTWSIVLGKHTLKAGGGGTRYQLNRFNRFAVRGSLGFNNIHDFVVGQIDTLQAASGDPQRYFRATDYGAFIQDDFKVRSNLTLNLGLRWDSFEFSHDLLERTTIFDPSLVPKADPFLFASDINLPGLTGTPGVGPCGSPQCRTNNNFGPRAGFSWDPFHDHKTVVRGGYGIYFQRLSNQNFLQGCRSCRIRRAHHWQIPCPASLAAVRWPRRSFLRTRISRESAHPPRGSSTEIRTIPGTSRCLRMTRGRTAPALPRQGRLRVR
jgi:hypothetical protein